jgi:hypothetical protein
VKDETEGMKAEATMANFTVRTQSMPVGIKKTPNSFRDIQPLAEIRINFSQMRSVLPTSEMLRVVNSWC